MEGKTGILNEQLSECVTIEDLREFVYDNIEDLRSEWAHKIRKIVKENAKNDAEFARKCGLSRAIIGQWKHGKKIPSMKIYFIRVGLAAGYSVKKMNRLITRYGGFPELSSKNIVDSACIYVIKKYKGDDPVGKFVELLSRISDNDHIGSVYAKTHAVDSQLEQVSSDDELIEFINEHSDTAQTGYLKFCDYALQKINEAMESDIGHAKSIDSYTITWSRSMRDFAYAIENHSVRPDYSRVRENIIALGIMLNMTTLQVDEMLEMAHMEELCPKNIPECILIYCMERAAENRYDNGNGYDSDYLRQYTVNTMSGFRDIKELKWYMKNLEAPDR